MTMHTDHARQLARRADALKKKIAEAFGSFGYVSLSIRDGDQPFSVYASGDGYGRSGLPKFTLSESFPSFEEAIEAAEAAWEAHLSTHDITVRRKMALSIIDLVDAEGVVTDRSLRLAGFTQAQIDAQHQAASELAHEMASKGPFCVVLTGAGNHEEIAA